MEGFVSQLAIVLQASRHKFEQDKSTIFRQFTEVRGIQRAKIKQIDALEKIASALEHRSKQVSVCKQGVSSSQSSLEQTMALCESAAKQLKSQLEQKEELIESTNASKDIIERLDREVSKFQEKATALSSARDKVDSFEKFVPVKRLASDASPMEQENGENKENSTNVFGEDISD